MAVVAVGESLEDAIGRADHALYRSKAEGRNRVTTAASAPAVVDAHDSAQVLDLHPAASAPDDGPDDSSGPGGMRAAS